MQQHHTKISSLTTKISMSKHNDNIKKLKMIAYFDNRESHPTTMQYLIMKKTIDS